MAFGPINARRLARVPVTAFLHPRWLANYRTAAVSLMQVLTFTAWGIRHVWGMVGHSNLGLADALRRQEAGGRLRYYGIRHEGAASFAASAYGKLTRRPAECFAIAGPGATNLLTGLWDANVDRSPVLALTGQVDTQVLGPRVTHADELDEALARALAHPGPSLVEIVTDVDFVPPVRCRSGR